MRSRKLITTLSLTVVMLAVMAVPAMAYVIDGDLDDWGVDLSAGLGGDKSAWVPSSLTADWIVEDNIDGASYPGYKDWTGYSATGVHIKGHGTSYGLYAEPTIEDKNGKMWVQPVGGEQSDIEAFYFDSDATNAYFAIVTSVPESGWIAIGDLALDIDKDGYYEYGIALHGTDKGKVYKNPTWTKPSDFPDSEPCRITGGKPTGNGLISYNDTHISDNERTNYIIEVSVPRDALGNPPGTQLSNLHATITCGNDVIELEEVTWEEIPEFTTIAIPVGMIFGLFYFYRRKRQSREEKAK